MTEEIAELNKVATISRIMTGTVKSWNCLLCHKCFSDTSKCEGTFIFVAHDKFAFVICDNCNFGINKKNEHKHK